MTTATEPSTNTAQAEDSAAQLQMEVTDIVREEIGYNEAFASQIASAIVRGLRRKMGGREVYIPAVDRAGRDAAIRREFNGANLAEVCARHGVSKSTVYRITGRQPA